MDRMLPRVARSRMTGKEFGMKMVNVNGVHLHCADEGNPDGFPVVFSNSLGTDLRLWDRVFDLMPADLRLIRYDTRGHGLSSCPDGPYSVNDLAGDCAGLLERLDVKDCAFVGLSIGGLTAQELVLRWPGLVRAAILSNTGARIGEASMWHARIDAARSGRLEGISDAVLERWFSDRFRQDRTGELEGWRAMLTRTTAEGYAGCCEAIMTADYSGDLGGIDVPVQLIGGSEDGATPPDLVNWTASLLPGAKVEIIEGAGHLPCVDSTKEYVRCIMNFLVSSGVSAEG